MQQQSQQRQQHHHHHQQQQSPLTASLMATGSHSWRVNEERQRWPAPTSPPWEHLCCIHRELCGRWRPVQLLHHSAGRGRCREPQQPLSSSRSSPSATSTSGRWLLSNAAVSSDATQAAAGATGAGQQPQTAAAAHSNCSCTIISSSSSFIVSCGWWGLVQLLHHSAGWGRCAEQERGTSWQQLYNSWLPRAATDNNGQERCSRKASAQQQVAALG